MKNLTRYRPTFENNSKYGKNILINTHNLSPRPIGRSDILH